MKKHFHMIWHMAWPVLALALGGCISPANREEGCHKQAEDRLELYNKPDTFPISQREKTNALAALYNECMRDNDYRLEADMKNAKKPALPSPSETVRQVTTTFVAPPMSAPTAAYSPTAPAPTAVTVRDASTLAPAIRKPSYSPTSNRELENILMH